MPLLLRSLSLFCAIACAAFSSPALAEGVGHGVHVFANSTVSSTTLRWELHAQGTQKVLSSLSEDAQACATPSFAMRTDERRGGLLVSHHDAHGETVFLAGDRCFRGTGAVSELLAGMSLFTTDQLLPLKGSVHRFGDRIPSLRHLLSWHRSNHSEAHARFAVGPIALEKDHHDVSSLLMSMGAVEVELARPSAYGASLTVLNPGQLPDFAAVQMSIMRAGQEVRITQLVGIASRSESEYRDALITTLGHPYKIERSKGHTASYWKRGPLTLLLESAGGHQSRIVWQDLRCVSSGCPAADISKVLR